jgi:hypothetical protein
MSDDLERRYPERPLLLQSPAGKALLRLTREQFSFWEEQVGRVARSGSSESIGTKYKPSHAVHYWHILSFIALEGDEESKVRKKRAEESLPRAATETGRRYLAECEQFGLVRTIKDRGIIYAALTEDGERVLASTLGRWRAEFGRLHKEFSSELIQPESG